MTPLTIGKLVLGYRLRAGITQRELAHSASVSVRTIRDIEQDRVRHLDRAADIHRRARWLARETGNRFPEARALIGLAAVHRRRAEPGGGDGGGRGGRRAHRAGRGSSCWRVGR